MGYGDPPWTFTGRALYQLHLVRASEARKHVPAELPLVECFGYTLGGVFLARYSDSPVGPFDELVTIAGLVWNFPGSAAWASRVYVSNREACLHGRAHCGLPSSVADFEGLGGGAAGDVAGSPGSGLLRVRAHAGHRPSSRLARLTGLGRQRQPRRQLVCELQLPAGALEERAAGSGRRQAWPGPRLRLRLPNYSGGIPECPGLLRYACRLAARVRAVRPITEVGPRRHAADDVSESEGEAASSILRKPLITLLFGDMRLRVAQPEPYVLKAADPAPVLRAA